MSDGAGGPGTGYLAGEEEGKSYSREKESERDWAEVGERERRVDTEKEKD